MKILLLLILILLAGCDLEQSMKDNEKARAVQYVRDQKELKVKARRAVNAINSNLPITEKCKAVTDMIISTYYCPPMSYGCSDQRIMITAMCEAMLEAEERGK